MTVLKTPELKISKLLRVSNIRKKKGGSAFDIFQFLLILVFQNCNLYHFTLVFTRYILLEWMRRKKNDQKTICELFYVCCDDIQDIELSTALKRLLKIFSDGIKNGAVAIKSEIKIQLTDWFVCQPVFIRALFPEFLVECASVV